MKYNEIIKEGLKIRKWTNAELGREVNRSRQSVGTFINKNSNVEFGLLLEYLWVMGLDVYISNNKIMRNSLVKQMVKNLIKESGKTQEDIAIELGLASQGSVAARLDERRGEAIRVNSLLEILGSIDVEIKVVDRMGSEREWELTIENESEKERLLREFEEKRIELEERGLI